MESLPKEEGCDHKQIEMHLKDFDTLKMVYENVLDITTAVSYHATSLIQYFAISNMWELGHQSAEFISLALTKSALQ